MMDVQQYISRTAADPAVQSLVSDLGPVIPDEYGGLRILDYPEKGVAVYFDEGDRIRTVFLYSDGRDDHKQSVLPIPHGLGFDDTYAEVLAKLGKPQELGSSSSGRRWARFDYGSHSIHLEFEGGSEKLSLARVMVPV